MMKLFFIAILLLSLVISVFSAVGMPGGASSVDVNDGKIKSVAKYVISQAFPDVTESNYGVLSATKQVVNGIIYGLTIEINRPMNLGCVVEEFKVLEKFSKGTSDGLMILHSELKDDKCTNF